jgi:ATP-binding cassette subfamily B protein
MSDSILPRFFRQPDCLTPECSEALASLTGDESVKAYAYCDLDRNGRFASEWLVCTERKLIRLHAGTPEVIELSQLDKFELFEGISSSRLNMVMKDGSLGLSVQYTRRQARSVGTLQFVAERLKQTIQEGKDDKALSADLDPAKEYGSTMLESVQEARSSIVMNKSGVIMRLLAYLKPHKLTFMAGLIASVLITAIQLVSPLLTRAFIDKVVTPVQNKARSPEDVGYTLALILGGFAFVFLSTALFGFVRLRVMAIVGEKISMKLREDVYNHLQKLSLAFFSRHPTGSLITRVSSDTDRLWDFITFGVLDVIVSVMMIVGVGAALIVQNWKLALLVLIPIPFITWLFYAHSKGIQVLFLRIWRKWSSMTAVLSDVIPGVRVVKAFAREKFEEERFRERNVAVQDEAILLHKNWTTFWPSVEFLMRACTLIVWLVGAPLVIKSAAIGGAVGTGMTLGMFMAFVNYMWMFWGPVEHLGMMSRTLNRVTTSASRIFEVLDTVPDIVSKPEPVRLDPVKGRVTFEDVTFTYDGIRNVLKGVSFDVKEGEMIGLVGPSGGGKTTLVNLICRFYDVKNGVIRVDGHDVRDLDLSLLRRQIGVVLQEPYLFHGTIAENIAYGSDGKTVTDIINAAKAAHAHEFICRFRDGYETIVGERGQTLSGGERQRISIARAILHDPRILILDEATSSVDTETEKKIQEALRRLVAGRTTFAIAHRLSTLSSANRLFVLEEGRLAEHGTHAELLAKPDGVYAKLHKTQMELHATIAV